jgi:hypothetical protein
MLTANEIARFGAEALNAILTAIGPDRDLVDEPDPLTLGVARLGPGTVVRTTCAGRRDPS